ncbi:MAG: hypothetical protein Kilf2KO_44430 [Rhodospirillales bacterium]
MKWRRTPPDLPSRAETIRRLVEVALQLENPDGLNNEYRNLARLIGTLAGRYKGRFQTSDDPAVNNAYGQLYVALVDFTHDIQDLEEREASRPSLKRHISDDCPMSTDPIEALMGIPWWAMILIALFIWHGLVAPIIQNIAVNREIDQVGGKANNGEEERAIISLYAASRSMRTLDGIAHTLKLILYVLLAWFLVDLGVLDRP